MNETLNYTLQNVDVGSKVADCFKNGILTDSCAYQKICKPLNDHFLTIAVILFSLEVLSFIGLFVWETLAYKRKKKPFDIKYYKVVAFIESKLKFGFMLFVMLFLYYNFFKG